MWLLLSGEGPTDLGDSRVELLFDGVHDLEPGPLAVIVDQLVAAQLKYSVFELGHVGYVRKQTLDVVARERGGWVLPGRKHGVGTAMFVKNAQALAAVATKVAEQTDDEVVAILFRDADGTRSTPDSNWAEKRASMMEGFKRAQYSRGVAMVPRPKSEAWILCALKADAYSGCDALEDAPRNDHSPNSLKKQLAECLGQEPTRDVLMEVASEIDAARIRMPSFLAFTEDLVRALGVSER